MLKQRKETITKEINANSTLIFDIITNNNDWQWRTSLKDLRIISDTEFIEVDDKGYELLFEVIIKEPTLYQFKIKSNVFDAIWTGKLIPIDSNRTAIEFTEDILFKNVFYKLLSYLFINIYKTQTIYINDLENKIKELQYNER